MSDISSFFQKKNQKVYAGVVVSLSSKTIKVRTFNAKAIVNCIKKSEDDLFEEGDHVLVLPSDDSSSTNYVVDKYDQRFLYPTKAKILDI